MNQKKPLFSSVIPTSIGQAVPTGRKPENAKMWELDAVISNHIIKALEMTGGKVHGESGAARLLNINPSTLRKRMQKLGIPFGRESKQETNSHP